MRNWNVLLEATSKANLEEEDLKKARDILINTRTYGMGQEEERANLLNMRLKSLRDDR